MWATKSAELALSGMLKVPSTTPTSSTTEEHVYQQQLMQQSHQNITKLFIFDSGKLYNQFLTEYYCCCKYW